MKYLIFFGFPFLVLFGSCSQDTGDLAQKFTTLPETVEQPWCYWYWINDDISKEGITKDLLAMKEAGIGTALVGNINPAGKDGNVPLFSDAWWECLVHAVNEAKRIGIDIGMFNSPGWSQSGGPWNTADKTMRYIVSSETKVKGPGKATVTLSQPDSLFQDIAVLAFPSVETGENPLTPKIGSSPGLPGVNRLADGDFSTGVLFAAEEKTYRFELSFPEEMEANSLFLYPLETISADCRLYARIAGKDSLVREFRFDRSNFRNLVGPMIKGPLALSLPGVKSSGFTLVLDHIRSTGPFSDSPVTGLAEIVISEDAVLEKYVEKQLGKMHPTALPEWNSYSWEEQPVPVDAGLMVNPEEIVDLSGNLQPDGTLEWNVPEGSWTILRFGMKPTGVKNHPAAPQGTGYEVDKMDSEKARSHFENFVGELLKRLPEDSKSALKYVVIDSYEVGSQNWTDGYAEKFIKKYGYDPIPYLPALTGRVVGGVAKSERFLWDLRRAVADDIAEEYVGGLKKISNEHHMKLWLENYGHWGFPSEFLKYGGQSDLVGGEFWNERSGYECKAASSSAHIYGKPTVYSEAFTASQQAFLRHPALLKQRGDWSFTEGINHLVLHVYIHQPDDNRKPGVNAWFGTEFNRHNTWFKYASTWTDYIRRCQLMLQQGNYAADVCYFIGEDAPVMTGPQIPSLPEGYSFDYINAETILTRLTVQDGRFTLPGGMSYRIMILPPLKTMRPEVIKKLEELVKEGGIIYGPRPERSPSLKNYPECDREVEVYAEKLWGNGTDEPTSRDYGKGKVFDKMELEEVFSQISLEKDVVSVGDYPVLWTHRTTEGHEIYFITNQSEKEIAFDPSFRVKGKNPQLWDPVTGEVHVLNEFETVGNRTRVPLKLAAYQSYFVVFTEKPAADVAKKSYRSNFPEREVLTTLDGPWQVAFEDKEIGPQLSVTFPLLTDWSENQDENIRYYSGSAVYKKEFEIDEVEPGDALYLNLGNVQVVSRVKLNGEFIGGTWIKPHLLNTKGLLKKGKNSVEIEVANLWRNRLIKEKSLPENERKAWWLIDDIQPNEQLQPSGLLGPVTVERLKDKR